MKSTEKNHTHKHHQKIKGETIQQDQEKHIYEEKKIEN